LEVRGSEYILSVVVDEVVNNLVDPKASKKTHQSYINFSQS
jgi:hypothetical protein